MLDPKKFLPVDKHNKIIKIKMLEHFLGVINLFRFYSLTESQVQGQLSL